MIGLVEDYEKCGFDTQKDSLEFCSANPALPCCLAGAQRQLVNLLNTPDLTEARRILVLAIAIFCIIIVYFVMMRLTSHRRAIPYEKESRAGSRSHYFGTPALLSMNDRMTPEIPQTHITRAPTAAKISTKGAPSPRSALPPSPPSETVMISFSEGRQPSVDSLSQIKQAYYSPRVASRTGVSAGGAWPPSPTSPASDSGTPKLGSPITYMTLRGFRIHSGRTYKVRRQQRAMMDSELNLKPGAVVRIFEVFDDGLAFGQAVDTGEKGYFDISCVETS